MSHSGVLYKQQQKKKKKEKNNTLITSGFTHGVTVALVIMPNTYILLKQETDMFFNPPPLLTQARLKGMSR